MTFSGQALQAIRALAESMGLPVQPAVDGSFSFVFERSGTLTLTSATSGERTIVSLDAPLDRLDQVAEQQLFSAAGPDLTTGRFLSTGITGDGSALFAVSLDDDDMNLPALEVVMQQLFAARASID